MRARERIAGVPEPIGTRPDPTPSDIRAGRAVTERKALAAMQAMASLVKARWRRSGVRSIASAEPLAVSVTSH